MIKLIIAWQNWKVQGHVQWYSSRILHDVIAGKNELIELLREPIDSLKARLMDV